MKAYLVYQCGIANVFIGERRVLQHAYSPCEFYAAGLRAAGVDVAIVHCDMAGDVALFRDKWASGKGDLWAESKHPPIAA